LYKQIIFFFQASGAYAIYYNLEYIIVNVILTFVVWYFL